MSVFLGIDIGSTSTKVAALRKDGSVLSLERIVSGPQASCLAGALEAYIAAQPFSAADVERIVLTGVGSSYVEENLLGINPCKVDEFYAGCSGALALSGQEKAVIATLGTGTAFLWAEKNGTIRHLCGTGIGGATLHGLCGRLAGATNAEQIDALVSQGDLTKVDLTIADITCTPPPTLDPTLTAANFGKMAEDLTPADLAAGAANLVLQAIGTMTVLACQCCDYRTVVLTGSMTAMPQVKVNFEIFERLYGIHYIIPENAAFSTAIGAVLYTQSTPDA